MKKLIAVVTLFIFIIAFGVFESAYISHTFTFLENQLKIVSAMLEKDDENIDTEENITHLKDLHTEWQKKTKVLKFFVWHTGIKDVEVGLSRITSYTEENNYTEAYVELNNLIDYSKHYKEDYRFSIQNIV